MKDSSLLPLPILLLGMDSRTLLWLKPVSLISILRLTEANTATGVPTVSWNAITSPFRQWQAKSCHQHPSSHTRKKINFLKKKLFIPHLGWETFSIIFWMFFFSLLDLRSTSKLKLSSTLSCFQLLAPKRNICWWPLCAWPRTSSYHSHLPGHTVIIVLFSYSSLLTVPPNFILSLLIWSVMSPIFFFFFGPTH